MAPSGNEAPPGGSAPQAWFFRSVNKNSQGWGAICLYVLPIELGVVLHS